MKRKLLITLSNGQEYIVKIERNEEDIYNFLHESSCVNKPLLVEERTTLCSAFIFPSQFASVNYIMEVII